MVSNKLEQLLNGEQGYQRERAPEPLLLPRIATRIAPERLGYAAYLAEILSRRWAPCSWPALADATSQVIASRHMVLDDTLLADVCESLPHLPIALVRFGGEAGQRAETLVGSDAVSKIRVGLESPEYMLREKVKWVFSEPDPPRTAGDLMVFVRNQLEADNTQNQRNLLAYFLPLVPAQQHQWMIQLLVSAPAIYFGLDWSAAAAASRIAGLLDQAATEQFMASLQSDDAFWTGHVRALLAADPAASVFLELVRALPCDSRLESLLNDETDLASLDVFLDGIVDGWGGAPPLAMAEPPGADDTGAEDVGPEFPASRGIGPGIDDGADDALPDMPDWPKSPPSPAAIPAPVSEPAIAAETLPERSLQTQVFADDDGALLPVSQGFKKGARHDVRLWIGRESKHGIKADAAINEPVPDEQELQSGSMEIFITLVYDSKVQTRGVTLPVDRAKPSKPAVFSVDVEQDAMFVSAELWLQHKGRVFQYLKLNGLTFAEPDATTTGIALKVESLIRALPEDTAGGNFEMAMVKKDDKYIVFGPRGAEKTEVSLQGSGGIVENINRKLFNATKGLVRHSADNKGTSWVEDHDEEAMQLLREMARVGQQPLRYPETGRRP